MLLAAQSAFDNQMAVALSTYSPGIDPAVVIATGATQLRDVFTAEQVPGIVMAYMKGLKATFLLSIIAGGVAFVVSLSNRWQKLVPETSKNVTRTA